ncbi:MAG: hypothetical protein ACR2PJ_03615 [Pseudomonadales bacterium]
MTTTKDLKSLKALGVTLAFLMLAGSLAGCNRSDCAEDEIYISFQCVEGRNVSVF